LTIETPLPLAAMPESTDPTTPILRAESVTKRFGARKALDGVSLSLFPGQWVALLGPNGAGKSTLFSVLTGLFVADEGDIHIDGLDLRRQAPRALSRLGVVFQQSALDLDLSAAQNLRFHAQLHGLLPRQTPALIEQALRRVGLWDDRDRAVRELSGGNRRKVELARARLADPAVLLMDEPTVGLDPRSRRDLMDAARNDVTQHRRAILWATHLIEEAQAADRVVVLHQGRILADGTPQTVAEQLGGGDLESAVLNATRGGPPAANHSV
jgi:ABC-2 type transport system ATP-binding protein